MLQLIYKDSFAALPDRYKRKLTHIINKTDHDKKRARIADSPKKTY